MKTHISNYEQRNYTLPLIFTGCNGFMSILSFVSCFMDDGVTKLPSIIVTAIMLLATIISLIIGMRNLTYCKKHMKELKNGRKIELEIFGFIDSNKLIAKSNNVYSKYVIGYDKCYDQYYRSNKSFKIAEYNFNIGDKIVILYKNDNYFYMETDEYLKSNR